MTILRPRPKAQLSMAQTIPHSKTNPGQDARCLIPRLASESERWLNFLISKGAGRDEAPDLLQMALVKAALSAESIRHADTSSAWFYTILRNTLLDHIKSHAAARKREEAWQLETISAHDAPSDLQKETVTCQCVWGRFDEIHPRYAQMLRAIDLEEMSPADYAKQSGLSAASVHVALHRARKALREVLIEHCGHCASGGACLNCECR